MIDKKYTISVTFDKRFFKNELEALSFFEELERQQNINRGATWIRELAISKWQNNNSIITQPIIQSPFANSFSLPTKTNKKEESEYMEIMDEIGEWEEENERDNEETDNNALSKILNW